ncbi:hypothetical protein [Legionella waltersii]|uniref:Uncharacterized protein n=1 Tax=Legionella waltersii TaxID=66969 RepID=A0A0W1A583_9GAMM|nr:hypothetical protein [Legionella waltersii]KTD76384.1 hypothetical protein Lwal_2106 [Legionella waltersii]SNV14097.1 Uncharacterised protein [Legionella waltersii]
MGWFSSESISSGLSSVGSGLYGGAQWLWNNASPLKIVSGVFNYTANTAFTMVEQVLALRKAIPTLVNNPQAKKIVNGMAYVAVHDILPIVALNYANNSTQQYFRNGYNEDGAWYAPYMPYMSALGLLYYAYLAYNKAEGKRSTPMEAALTTLPLIPLVYMNSNSQQLVGNGYNQDMSWYAPYSLFLSGLTAVNYLVQSYTWREGAQATVRVAILDTMGPGAFNSNKTKLPKSICDDMDCNFKRKIKGWGREPFILIGNDFLTFGISKIPYVGGVASKVLSVYFNGRYILRVTTPELCERHKFLSMPQETGLSLGLTYYLTTELMDKVLEATVGMPPYLYYRALKHFLLLMHINVAAHMTFQQIDPKDATLTIDPLTVYERVNRFLVDVVFDGMMKRIPIDFKPDPNAPPLIPLSPALQFGTMLLNSDVERERKTAPGFFTKAKEKALVLVLPSMMRSADGFTTDPIVVMYWPSISKVAVNVVNFVDKYGHDRRVKTLAWAPKTTAEVINLKFGIPKKITRFILMLSHEQDFWNLMVAIKLWFLRHSGIKSEVKIEPLDDLGIHGERSLVPLPSGDAAKKPVIPAEQLQLIKGQDSVLPIEAVTQLTPFKGSKVSIDPDMLLVEPVPTGSTKQELSLFPIDPHLMSTKAEPESKNEMPIKRKVGIIVLNPDMFFYQKKSTGPIIEEITTNSTSESQVVDVNKMN